MAEDMVSSPSEHAAALSIISNWGDGGDEPKKEESATAAPSLPASPKDGGAAQAAAEPAQGETTTETAAETAADTAALKEEIRRHKLRYRDEDIEVDDTELKSGYLKGKDYTQKTQEVARQKQELDATIKARIEPALKQYADNLRTLEAVVVNTLEPQLRNTDWNSLAQNDPGEWARRMQAANNINGILGAIRTKQKEIDDQRTVDARNQKQQELVEAAETLQRDIPGFNHEQYGKAVQAAVRLGMKQEKADQISDPSVVKALHYAGLYLALQDAKPQVEKQVHSTPKVLKPGGGERSDGGNEKWNAAMSKLKKSGKEQDAVAAAKFLIG